VIPAAAAAVVVVAKSDFAKLAAGLKQVGAVASDRRKLAFERQVEAAAVVDIHLEKISEIKYLKILPPCNFTSLPFG
jgi:hypothetical protein